VQFQVEQKPRRIYVYDRAVHQDARIWRALKTIFGRNSTKLMAEFTYCRTLEAFYNRFAIVALRLSAAIKMWDRDVTLHSSRFRRVSSIDSTRIPSHVALAPPHYIGDERSTPVEVSMAGSRTTRRLMTFLPFSPSDLDWTNVPSSARRRRSGCPF
jgi:hypothetical protein